MRAISQFHSFLNPGAAHLPSLIPGETGDSSLLDWAAPRLLLHQSGYEDGGSN